MTAGVGTAGRAVACAIVLLLLAGSVHSGSLPAPDAPPGSTAAEATSGYVEGRIRHLAGTGAARSALVELQGGGIVQAQVPEDVFGGENLPPFQVGERVELYFSPEPGGDVAYVVIDWVRRPALLALVALFLLASVAVARFKGLRAFLSTAASLAIVIGFVVPRIVEGASPVLISFVGVGGILVLAIYFVHGVSWSTTAALVGTAVAVVVTMLLGVVFTRAARLTGYGTEDALMIAASSPDVALRGLMLAGLLIGALGALTDITIVQAAVVRELAHVDPDTGLTSLYRRAMNVGLDHIGSLVNTLVLAYTGAALPLLVLLTQGDFDMGRALNLELIAAEVVHTLVGSIGLILAVPITTLIAAAMFRGDRLPLRPGELEHAHHHG